MFERRLIGYADKLSVAPGETLSFKVSCLDAGRYHADLVRLEGGDDPGGSGFSERVLPSAFSGEYTGRAQSVQCGSYATIPLDVRLDGLADFSLSAVVLSTTPFKGRQCIVGRWNEPAKRGFALVVTEDGGAGLLLGDGVRDTLVGTGVALPPGRWCHLAARFDSRAARVKVLQTPLEAGPGACIAAGPASVEAEIKLTLRHAEGPLMLAAWNEVELGADHGFDVHPGGAFNGKIARPRIVGCTVPDPELAGLAELTPPPALAGSVLGWWDLSRGIGTDEVRDASANGLHGRLHRGPVRAVTGPGWRGANQRWIDAPEEYDAVHFHDDDLLDAGWETDFEFTVPRDLPSGIYAARIRQGAPEGDEHIVFFVRPGRANRYRRVEAPLAFLAPTASYLAYGNYRLRLKPNPIFGPGTPTCVNDAFLARHPELGASLYDVHSDWSGVHFSSRHRPITNLRPRQNRIWGFPADLNIVAWLHHLGVSFEVITDEDLHEEGAGLLGRYRCVLTGSHPEYYSTSMLDAVDAYLEEGGRWMYLGGNGFYWRIAFHPVRPGIIEVRRAEDGTRAWIEAAGEYYHEYNGEYGGLWRRLGRPPNRTVGVGFAAQGFEGSTFYRRAPGADNPRARFIFEGVPGEIIGDFGSVGGGASGEEIDRFDVRLGSPAHALVLASATEHDAAMLRTKEEFLSTIPPMPDRKVRSDLVFFECPNGGAVFSTGSIAWAGALAHESFTNNVARITENVLRRFMDPKPFPLPWSR